MDYLRGILILLWFAVTLLLLLAVPTAFLGPPIYLIAWYADFLSDSWVMSWTAWVMGRSVRSVPQEFFSVLWKLTLVSWLYILAYQIFTKILFPAAEPPSTQGSAPAVAGTLPPREPPRREERRRKPIPRKVRLYVWQRDGGKCVECGSKEKLEYDHIIPLSKGGSDTDRNLQLLCQRCNRSKGARIG